MSSSSNSDSEDDIPLTSLSRNVPESNVVQGSMKPPVLDESSEEDSVPLSQIKRKSTSELKTSNTPNKKSKTTKSKTPTKSKSKKKEKKSVKTEKKNTSIRTVPLLPPSSFKQQECSEALYKTVKGRVVQSLLCRWWYSITWPAGIDDKEAPEYSQALDGFDGTYIVVKV